jgi:hypothetical protein
VKWKTDDLVVSSGWLGMDFGKAEEKVAAHLVPTGVDGVSFDPVTGAMEFDLYKLGYKAPQELFAKEENLIRCLCRNPRKGSQ